jgi:hypothetical protein
LIGDIVVHAKKCKEAFTAAFTPRAPVREGFNASPESAKIEPDAKFLLNLQPQTVKQAGYSGATKTFEAEKDTLDAIRTGFRTLVLQIDYTESSNTDFSPIGKPALLFREEGGGAMIASNAGSIRRVAEAIAERGFSLEYPNSADPILLYLHVARAPDQVAAPKKYLEFLSQIAAELEPIAPMHLGLTPLGNFHRHKNEYDVLNTPIHHFSGKVIVMTNADTSLFTRAEQLNLPRFEPAKDLNYWTNVRVFQHADEPTKIGISKPGNAQPRAFVLRLSTALAMSETQKAGLQDLGKTAFLIAMPSQSENPSKADLEAGLALGIHSIPLDPLAMASEFRKDYLGAFSAQTWSPKAVPLRKS